MTVNKLIVKVKVRATQSLPANAVDYYNQCFNNMTEDGFTPGEIIENMINHAMLEAQLQEDYPDYYSMDIKILDNGFYEVELLSEDLME